VKEFLTDFLENLLQGHERNDIRAIVLAGDASSSAFAELGELALDAVGTQEVKLATGIAPADVIAYGAAHFIRGAYKYRRRQPGASNGDPDKKIPEEKRIIGHIAQYAHEEL
jgi:hypothetical protein